MAWKSPTGLGIAAALAAQLLVAAPAPADRAPSGSEPGIGYVDLQQVRTALMQTPNWKVMSRKVEDAKTRAENDVEAARVTRYLSTTERAERDVLRAKQKPTETEKLRAAELDAKSDGLDREYTTLAQTEKPSAEQAARIRELDAIRKEGAALLEREVERASQAVQKVQQELLEELGGKVEKAVAQVARLQKLNVVVDRQLVLFGGTDVTADVLKQLK